MNDYFISNDDSAISWSARPPNYNNWGQEPSIGINTTTNLDMAKAYGGGNEQIHGDTKNSYTLFTFYIDVDSTNILKLDKECQWAQITCDNTANTIYHLTGYMENNNDINIIDKGREKIFRITSDLYNLQDTIIPNSRIVVYQR